MNSKFEPLATFLMHQKNTLITMTFSEIETILGYRLCYSARKYTVYWSISKIHRLPLVCAEANYKVDSVNIHDESVRFAKI